MYILEGNIGTGKSTFLGMLSEMYPSIKTELEPIVTWQREDYGRSLLTNFYTDPYRWAFSMETFTLCNRVHQHLADQQKPDPLLVERSIYSGHYCFAQNSYQSGFLSDIEWKKYLSMRSTLTNNYCKPPRGFIYLRTDPYTSISRIQKRNRAGENLISFEYINDIHYRHELFLIKKFCVEQDIIDTPVLVLDCTQEFETDPVVMDRFAQAVISFIAYTNE